MENVFLSQKEFDDMYEYSSSLPTGTYLGKTWKAEKAKGWYMGEYIPDPESKLDEDGEPETVGIRWRKIIVI